MLALKCSDSVRDTKLGFFYNSMKKEINELGRNTRHFVTDEVELKEAMQNLQTATDRDGNALNMSTVGISTGIFVPCEGESKDKDWLAKADKTALEHAKTLNLPNKNSVAIYDEESGSLIADEKVEKCLEMGVYLGLYK